MLLLTPVFGGTIGRLWLMNKASQVLQQGDYTGKSLYFASANTMEKDMDTMRVEKDTAHGNAHVRENLYFRSLLRNSQKSHLNGIGSFIRKITTLQYHSLPAMMRYVQFLKPMSWTKI